jgi:hypothetical protein
MKITYTVSKEKSSNRWYAHKVGFSNIPVMSERGTFGTKKNALHIAADCMGIPYKEYMKLRQKGVN